MPLLKKMKATDVTLQMSSRKTGTLWDRETWRSRSFDLLIIQIGFFFTYINSKRDEKCKVEAVSTEKEK